MKHHIIPESVFSRPKVQKQLITIFLIVLIIPVLFSLFMLKESNKTLGNHYLEQTESESQRVKSVMFDVTTTLYNIAENLASDDELTDILYTRFTSESQEKLAVDSYRGIYDILYRDTSISSVEIYTSNPTINDYSNFRTVTDEIESSDWYQKAAHDPSVFWQTMMRTDKYENVYWELNLFRRIPLPKTGDFAVINITVSDNYLRNRIDNTSLKTVMSINENPVFYGSKSFIGKELPISVDYSQPYYTDSGLLMLNNKKTMTAINTLIPLNSGDTLYIVSYNPGALTEMNRLLRDYLCITALVVLVPCILFLFFSRYFSGRILMLRKAMYQASHGNYDIMDSFTGNDEISETFQDLRTMISEIKQKEAEIYQARITEQEIMNRQQQMEFKMLASQINPHFLYNTLETIRMKAFTAGDREVATAIKLLGKSMRYVLENTGTVSIPLEKEINYIHTYISIQKLRFGDRFNFEERIAENLDLSEYQILPLMIQPIIENSISHGLEGMESGGIVLLEIFEQNSSLHIQISDNGKGMSPEELENLKIRINTKDETRTRSIGLYNINQRLHLCYGSDCQLQISSIKGQKTTFLLTFPLDKIKEGE